MPTLFREQFNGMRICWAFHGTLSGEARFNGFNLFKTVRGNGVELVVHEGKNWTSADE